MRTLLLSIALALPGAAHAVDDDDGAPPSPSPTTTHCPAGKIAVKTQSGAIRCVYPSHSALDDDARYQAVREYAYAGRYDEALDVLAAMTEGPSDRVLTYLGFIYRKQGKTDLGFAYYRKAIEANPDNLLARSYMGQGFAAMGRLDDAKAQLAEIRNRGGRGTWPETALAMAIRTGGNSSY